MTQRQCEANETIIDLRKFQIIEGILYIEGVGILVGHSAPEYGDVHYHLVFRGAGRDYRKWLAKAHRPELTTRYATEDGISYDKCWFTTKGFQGVDITDIPPGHYELLLEISTPDVMYTGGLRSAAALSINNPLYRLEVTSSGSSLTVKRGLTGSIQEVERVFHSRYAYLIQDGTRLEVIFPNGHSRVSIAHNVQENHVTLACANEEMLLSLARHLGGVDARVELSEGPALHASLMPLVAKVEEFISKRTPHTKGRIKVDGFYRDDRNNSVEAPFGLLNVEVQFVGSNNHLILHENSGLRNTFIEFRGDGGSFSIGERAGVTGTFRLGYGCVIRIGDGVTSTNPVYVTSAERTSIEIGDDCMLATNNQIRTDDSHAIYDVSTGVRVNPSKSIVIGNHVWIAYGATVLGGASIGDGSVIGAYALVKGVIPNNCVAAGIPAKVMRRDVFWERPLLLNYNEERIFAREYLERQTYVRPTGG